MKWISLLGSPLNTLTDPGSTCEGRCDTGYEPDLSCQCNGRCQDFDNCCEDYMDKCLIEGKLVKEAEF